VVLFGRSSRSIPSKPTLHFWKVVPRVIILRWIMYFLQLLHKIRKETYYDPWSILKCTIELFSSFLFEHCLKEMLDIFKLTPKGSTVGYACSKPHSFMRCQ
jgi:hypothetical protein